MVKFPRNLDKFIICHIDRLYGKKKKPLKYGLRFILYLRRAIFERLFILWSIFFPKDSWNFTKASIWLAYFILADITQAFLNTDVSKNTKKFCACYGVPPNIYLLIANNRNTTKRGEICSKLTIKTPERHQRRRSGVFIVIF